MKKYRKFFIIFIVLLVTGLLAWIIVWSCQVNYNRDYYLSLLRYRWSSEMTTFIKENERKIKNPASQMANEELNKVSATINATYSEKEKYLLSDIIYQNNQEIFENYDYVLIDYPPTINELSVSFLMLSDVIIVPINEGLNSIKGLIDLQNTLNHFCRETQKNIPSIKILLNGIKEGKNLKQILNLLNEKKLNNLSKSKISYSETFKTIENNLNSIWTNPYYWRQKKAYEELIAEIL